MSVEYRLLPKRHVPTETRMAGATCDVCGIDAWHTAHQRPVCTLGRVEDGPHGNMDYWELDLCTGCKDAVMKLLRKRAELRLPQMTATKDMTVREVIAELERFDLDAPVRVSVVGDAYKVRDIGRRDRPAIGVHPLLYVGAADAR